MIKLKITTSGDIKKIIYIPTNVVIELEQKEYDCEISYFSGTARGGYNCKETKEELEKMIDEELSNG